MLVVTGMAAGFSQMHIFSARSTGQCGHSRLVDRLAISSQNGAWLHINYIESSKSAVKVTVTTLTNGKKKQEKCSHTTTIDRDIVATPVALVQQDSQSSH